MVDAVADEFVFVVLRFVEANDSRHVEMLENLEIVFGGISSALKLANVVERAHEGDELVRDYPVEVSIFDLLVVLVLLVVELTELVPSESDCVFQALQAVQDRAGIAALQSVRSIAKRLELVMIGFE